MALAGIGSVLSVAGNVPALLGIRKGDYCPVPMSWAGWAAIMAITGWAIWKAGHLPSAIYTLACTAGCASVAVMALRIPAADRDQPVRIFGVRLDLVCLPGAVAGLLLLTVARSPAMTVTVTTITDALVFIPTYGHIWTWPGRESPLCYALFAAGAALILVTADWGSVTGWMYPVYLTAGDSAACLLVLARRKALATLAAANAAAAVRVLARVWEPALPATGLVWEAAPVTGLVWEAQPGPQVREAAAVARWTPRRPVYPPAGPWVSPSGPLT